LNCRRVIENEVGFRLFCGPGAKINSIVDFKMEIFTKVEIATISWAFVSSTAPTSATKIDNIIGRSMEQLVVKF